MSSHLTMLSSSNPVPHPEEEVIADARDRLLFSIMSDSPVSEVKPRRIPQAWRRMTVAGAAVAAVGVVILASPGESDSGALPGAAMALASEFRHGDDIVHTVDSGPGVAGADDRPSITRVETWAKRDGSVRRILTTRADGSYDDMLMELDDRRYRATLYSSVRDELYRGPWLETAPDSSSQQGLAVETISDYTSAVASGRARLDGDAKVRGQPAYRVVDTRAGASGGTIWFVSRDSEHPKLLQVKRSCSTPQSACATTTYSTYELTSDESALSVAHPSGAKVVNGSP